VADLPEPTNSLLAPVRQHLTKIDWLNWDETFLADYTAYAVEGNISGDSSQDVRKGFSLTFHNASGLFIPNGARTNMGIKVRLQRAIMTPSGPYWWPKGIYVLGDSQAVHKGADKSVSLTGYDKWALFNGDLGGTLTETIVIPIGTNVGEAIRAVATYGGETKFNFDVCTVVTPYEITREIGDTIADLLKELALIPSWDLAYDLQGYLCFKPLIDPLNKQVVADLSVGGLYRSALVDSEYSPEWSKVKNFWKIIGFSDRDTGKTYSGTAQNNNLDSPTNTATPPAGVGIKADILTDDNLTTDDLCTQRAIYELRENLRRIDRSRHSIMPLPFLKEGDCVQLEDAAAGIDNAKYEIQSITEPLGLGLMTIECWKVVSIFEIVAQDDFQAGVGNWQQLGTGEIDIFGITGNNALRKKTNGDPNGGYRVLDKSVVDFELIAYTRRDLVGTETANQYSVVDGDGNGYGIALDYGTNKLQLEKRAEWAVSTLADEDITPTTGQWYTLRLQKMSSNFLAEVYEGKTLEFGSPLAYCEVTDTSYTAFDRESVVGGYTYYTDEITVRKLL
jgi:hypothetical protein